MICHCGLPTWRYDENTLTCKRGHHIAPPEALPVPSKAHRWAHLLPVLSGALSGAAADLLLRHL